jgi:hypothetical protein
MAPRRPRTRSLGEPGERTAPQARPPIPEITPPPVSLDIERAREALARANQPLAWPDLPAATLPRARSLNMAQRAYGNQLVTQALVSGLPLVTIEVEVVPVRPPQETASERTAPDALPEAAFTEQAPERPQTSPPDASPVVPAPIGAGIAETATSAVEAAVPAAEDKVAETEAPAPESETATEAPPPEQAVAGEAVTEAAVSGGADPPATGGASTGAAADADIPILIPEPPTELSPPAQERLGEVQHAGGGAARAQARMPSAEANVGQAREAVTTPPAESAGRAQGALVEALGEQPRPSPEIEQFCKDIRRIIRLKRPPDEENLVKADPGNLAQEAGQQLDQNIQGDANRVSGSYSSIEGAPQGQPGQQGQPLQGVPGAATGPDVDAQRATPDAVPQENVSLEADTQSSQVRMDEAGMNTEPASLVQSGPLADARAAQGELEAAAERDPAEVLAEQESALGRANEDMSALQAQALAALQRSRAATGGGVEGQRQGMVGTEEQMRADAGRRAQAVFQRAQTDVQEQLRHLPSNAMQKWTSGVEVLKERFKADLREVERWIQKRHEGGWGTVVSLWDEITGLPGWVTEAYVRAEAAFGDGVCDLIREISTDVNTVVAACQAIIQNADVEIGQIYDSLPASLQDWAMEERSSFQGQLHGLSQQVAETRDNFNRDLVQRASQAVDEVRAQIHELRQKAKGLIGRVIDAVNAFLEDPARAIINGLLSILGIPPASFWALVARIQQVISDIAADPMKFANNLVEALKAGFEQFFDNFGRHFLQGLLEWLFSGLGQAGVQVPRDFSLKNVITFFLQLMGITWPNIRKILARHIGEENVALIEQAWAFLQPLIEQGPQGVFDMIKEQLSPQNILDTILQMAVDFVIETLIKQVAVRVIGLLNPAGAIYQALELIYKVLKWVFENAARIFRLVETVVNGIADILQGNISGMANAVERALGGLLVPVIDFLASFLGLGDLPEKVAEAVMRLQAFVLRILDRVIGWVVEMGRRLLTRLGLREEEKEEDEKGGDVKTKAQNALAAQLAGEHSHEEIFSLTQDVLAQFQPEGLKRLDISKEEGDYTIVAEASPRDPIIKLAPKGRRTTMVARVKFVGAGELRGDPSNRFYQRSVGRGQQERTLEAAFLPGTQGGGALIRPEAGTEEVKVATWNTGLIDPSRESNRTHAERQFVDWYERQPWKGNVTEIEIEINNSPCPFCVDDLKYITRLSPNMKGTIQFSKWYVNEKRPVYSSTEESLASLAPVWTIIDSSDKSKKVEFATQKV